MKKKILSLLLVSVLAFSLFGCASNEADKSSDTNNDAVANEGTGEITLDDVNEFLNTSGDLGPGSTANSVAVIPLFSKMLKY